MIDSKIDLSSALIKDVMSSNPKTINHNILAEKHSILWSSNITVIIENEKKQPIGVVHMHDILRAGVI